MKKYIVLLCMIYVMAFMPSWVLADEDANYQYCFLPAKGDFMQSYVGDCMPYYEDGVYYIYYLKEGGDSYRHSIFLTTTTDFVNYTEIEGPVLAASEDESAQDAWIGTGSVVKMNDTYYLFYTGHAASGELEYAEKVMLAKGSTPYEFEKVTDWEIAPDDSLNQKRDFRDPQAYVDEATGNLIFTITAAQDGIARIMKYTVSSDLTEITYDGIIFTDPIGKVYNLECSDTFKIGDTYYLTYSAQDDVLWYASSSEPYGPYSEPQRLDGPLFYAAKHVEDEENAYMVGWVRKSSESSTTPFSEWGGNLLVQKIEQIEDGKLVLTPVPLIEEQFTEMPELLMKEKEVTLSSSEGKVYQEICSVPDHLLLKGSFAYEGTGCFGLAFQFKDEEKDDKLITIDPEEQTLNLQFKNGERQIAQNDAVLIEGQTYQFTYIQENSLGVFYIDDVAALTVRLYKVKDKSLRFFAEQNNVTFNIF